MAMLLDGLLPRLSLLGTCRACLTFYIRDAYIQPFNSNGFTNASQLPLACPQSGVDSSAFSEDCLSMVLYVPPNLTPSSGVPTLVW